MAKTLNDLSLGQIIKFGKNRIGTAGSEDIPWRIVHRTGNNVVLWSVYALNKLIYDAPERDEGHSSRANYGNNRYSYSNIHQWLNSRNSDGTWYARQHDDDEAPSNFKVGTYAFTSLAGFLYGFSDVEYAQIQSVVVPCVLSDRDGGGSENITAKVYLPSLTEMGIDSGDGSVWDYIDNIPSFQPEISPLLSTVLGVSPTNEFVWSRTPAITASMCGSVRIKRAGADEFNTTCNSTRGVCPVIQLPNNTKVSETIDESGYYSVVYNQAPSAPSSITLPTTIWGGTSIGISWSMSTDDLDTNLTYKLERSVNGEAYTVVYEGVATTYTDSITFGWNTVRYRVCAYDSVYETSEYTTSESRTIINNPAPVISGTDDNLGVKSDAFSLYYVVTDEGEDRVTVSEALDGRVIKSFTATLGDTNTLSITGNEWLRLTNGEHIITITATDSIGSSVVRTYTFSKAVYSLSIISQGLGANTQPTRISLSVGRRVPTGATFRAYVCNNAFDTNPTWEDCTNEVELNMVYVFTNTSKTAAAWGVAIKVTIDRGDAEGLCYIKEIGGTFE